MMRVYDLLLRLYPASFRAEYGDEMRAIWARRRRDAAGPLGVPALWIATVFEILFNAAAVHRDILRQDLRYTARTLARSPGFALTAILVLALGVGANTAAFSVTDFVLIRPLPFPDPDRLVSALGEAAGLLDDGTVARQLCRLETHEQVLRRHGRVLGKLGRTWWDRATRSGSARPGYRRSASRCWACSPLWGACSRAAEDREGAPGTLLLSYQLWQAVFGGDAGVIGRRVNLDNEPYEVIGVMPRDFHFPSREAEFWMPVRFQEHDRQLPRSHQ